MYAPNMLDSRERKMFSRVRVIAVGLLLMCILISVFFVLPHPQSVLYRDLTDGQLYTASINKENMIIIENTDASFHGKTEKLSFSDFNNRLTPVGDYLSQSSLAYIIAGVYLLMCILLGVAVYQYDARYEKDKNQISVLIGESDE